MPPSPPTHSTPSFTFTIPSIHDDIDLDCRIYNPPQLTLFPSASEPPWNPRGAVVAHPYAPLGGCYDDLIVLALVEECLKKGLVVGTFNFRGAPGTKSSTSWTGKSELDDYISFAGLLIHYLQTLAHSLSLLHKPARAPSDTHLTPVPSNTPLLTPLSVPSSPISQPQQPINLLLAGYSYGSLITTHLPPTPHLLQRFASPQPTSAQSEIVARAQSLATETLKDVQNSDDARRGRGQISMGGEEGEPGSRRMSRDNSRKSIDAVRRSVDNTRRSIERSRRRLLRKGSSGSGGVEGSEESRDTPPPLQPEHIPVPSSPGLREREGEVRTSYLLVSPLLGSVASLATMSLSTLFHSHSSNPSQSTQSDLVQNSTFVIYGAEDFFTSAKKLRKWCAGLKGQGGGVFVSKEVEGAGHFWRERGGEEILRESVAGWIEEVLVKGIRGAGEAKG